MSLSQNSKILMSFLLENNSIQHKNHTTKTDNIIKTLYNELYHFDKYISTLIEQNGKNFFNLKITKLMTATQINKPKLFNARSFPVEIRQHIDNESTYELLYTFSLLNRKIKIHLVIEGGDPTMKMHEYNEHVRKILIWLCIVNEYASNMCSKELTIYIYMTSLTKNLPNSNISILSGTHVNTAFTTTCPTVSEIVVFRKEEWFKVLIHETFHNFALDFSDMNVSECHSKILSIFQVKSDVNLFEAYTEFWAEIMNSIFCGYFLLKNKQDVDEFLTNFEFFMNFEVAYGFFQMVKTLDFMGLKYKDLYSSTAISKISRDTLYKEDTNVLSYYVLTLILLNNYQGFLAWCSSHNLALLQFKKTTANLREFCIFIAKNYKTKSMISGVNKMENMLEQIKTVKSKNMTISNDKMNILHYIMKNMRMSIIELG
jgi:hypothetical protein